MAHHAVPPVDVGRLFDALSPTYDAVGVDFFGRIAGGLCRLLVPQPGQSWLDIGCGSGQVAAQVASVIGPSGRLVGIDLSQGMVDKARAWAASKGLTNLDFRVGDAQDPPPGLGAFDVIASSLVVFFLSDPGSALRKWRTLLVPGGRLGVTVFGPMDERWRHIDEVFEPYLPAGFVDARRVSTSGPFATDVGLEQLALNAGYTDPRVVSDDIDVQFDSVQQWYDFTWSTGQRAMWLSVPQDARAEVRLQAEKRFKEHAKADGTLPVVRQQVRHLLASTPAFRTL